MKKFLAFSLCIVIISMSFVIMSCDNGAESIDTSAETTVETTVETTTVETSATEEVGGLVMEEADPGSTGAEAEASGEVVTVDAENEIINNVSRSYSG